MNQTLLEQAALAFDASASQLTPLKGGHFAQVYEWRHEGAAYVLKIAPAEGETGLQAVRAMQNFLAYLAARGVPVVQPVASCSGSLVEPLEHEGKRYLVSAAHKIAGVRAETLLAQEWDAALIQRLGQVVGQFHAAAQTYTPSDPSLPRPAWDEAGNCFNPLDDLSALDADIRDKRARVMQALESLPKDRNGWGLAHLDIHFANFMVNPESDRIILIDFDDCAYGWFALDIAMLLFDVLVLYGADDRAAFADRFLDALLAGYRTEKEFSEFWVAQLPNLLKLLEIGVYAMLAQDYDPATCDDAWVNAFMPDRDRRLRADVPYLE